MMIPPSRLRAGEMQARAQRGGDDVGDGLLEVLYASDVAARFAVHYCGPPVVPPLSPGWVWLLPMFLPLCVRLPPSTWKLP